MIVIDASVVVALLTSTGTHASWAEALVVDQPLAAPHLLPVEVASTLRRGVLNGELGAESGALAHADLLDLQVELFDYGPLGARVWELRNTVSTYDAWYVALAEALDAPVATLDDRLAGAPGPGCRFLAPPSRT